MEWQPIATAPKDGTHILVFDRVDGPVRVVAYWAASILDGRDRGDWVMAEVSETEWLMRPTHWQPLPEMPE